MGRRSFCRVAGSGAAGAVVLPWVEGAGPDAGQAIRRLARVVPFLLTGAGACGSHPESAAPGMPDSAWSVDATPIVRIGQVSGAPESQLFQVGPLARRSDGAVVVALASELRFFAADGTWMRTVGRQGDGPGEYRDIESLYRIRGDSLVIWDRGTRRVTWLTPDGRFVRDARVAQEQGALVDVAAVLDDGRLVTARHVRMLSRSADYRRDTLSFALRSGGSHGERIPLARLGDEEWHVELRTGAASVTRMPFSRRALAAASADRIYLAETDRPEIRAFAPDGTPTGVLRFPGDPPPVTASLLDSLADYWHQETKAEAATMGYTLPERPSDEYRQETRRLSRVPSLPSVGSLVVDDRGNLWVREYAPPWRADAESSRWWVFGSDGSLRARIAIPPGLDVRCIRGDVVMGTVTDDLGVEYVEGYRLRR
jgi:hypothetical protein